MKKFWLILVGLVLSASGAVADEVVGSPHAWGMNYQKGYSEINKHMSVFNSYITVIISVIVVVVLCLMVYIAYRFRAVKNPVPSKTTHNTMLEIIWTVIPILVVVAIIIPSLKLLYYVDRVEKADMTLKVVGYQWYWGYELPDQKVAEFESHLVPEKDLKPGDKKLLTVDEPLYLPVGKSIRVLVTGDPLGVIHAWGIPSLSFHRDGVPGRINEGWMKIDRPGIYYGECYVLCGPDHAFMPIKIIAVPVDQFNQWVISKKGTPTDFSNAAGQVKPETTDANGAPQGNGTPSDKPVSGNEGSVKAIKDQKANTVNPDLPTTANKAPQGEDATSKVPLSGAGDSKENKEQDKKTAPSMPVSGETK